MARSVELTHCWHTHIVSTMLRNGRVYSPAAAGASAMLVDDGVIAWIGDDAAAAGISADHEVDLGGALVTPAFVDAHFHATDTGLALTGLDLSHAATLPQALDLLSRRVTRDRGWPVIGSGWDETTWPQGRAPTAAELDRASAGGVVYLARVDAHSAVASSALMAAVADLDTMAGYSPSGLLTRDAHHAARSLALTAVASRQRSQLHRAALAHAASMGIAAVHEMAGPEISSADDLQALLALADAEQFPRVFGFWGELNGVQTARELGAVSVGGDLFCDGSIGSHTAALHEPYRDDPSSGRGYLRYELGELVQHLLACTRAGLPTGFHAIGDAAVDLVVRAMTEAEAALGGAQVSGAGHRVEHAELVSDVAAFARAGLTASMQPAFDARWGDVDGMYSQRLGPERVGRMNQFAQLAAAGVPLAFGSDSPVTPADPWAAVRAATYPRNRDHGLSPRAAFAAHTRGGWRAARADSDGAGVLRPGAPATYAVFEAGGLGVDAPDELLARWSTDERAAVPGLPDLAPGAELPRCLQTVLDGVMLHDSGELA